ncbi:MAG: amidohydrolase family protein [Egibacteraceae bacterium]
MIDNRFVFDTAAHVMNLDRGNALGPAGQLFLKHLYEFHSKYTPEGEPVLTQAAFLREWTPRQVYEMVFEQSDTDMLVAQPLPMPDLFADGLSSWEQCAELASLDSERVIFWGTVNPLDGPKALDLMERQVWEFGAKAFKLYNARYDGTHLAWRMDDEQIAFLVLEKCQELGVDIVGVHKGVPLALQSRERTQVWDMDRAAENFAEINFVIFHVGLPFIDELCWQLTHHPNLYVSLAATVNLIARAPRQFAEILGKLLFWCGEDKIVYGSDVPIWHPQWALKAFCDFEMPKDLVEVYGYPQLDETAKRKILGENLLRLHHLKPKPKQ